MSRRGDEAQFRELEELAQMRELAVLEELGHVDLRMKKLDARIRELRQTEFTATSPSEAVTIGKWQSWRESELRRLGLLLAEMAHERALLASKCARLVAERQVVERIVEELRAQKRAESERARSHCS